MPARTRSVVLRIGLALAFSSAAAALAQAQPAPASEASGSPAGVAVPNQIPWDAFHPTERRYKIEAVRFKARDETGIDWLGSDEVMVTTIDDKGWTVSDTFGGVDSGETRSF